MITIDNSTTQQTQDIRKQNWKLPTTTYYNNNCGTNDLIPERSNHI